MSDDTTKHNLPTPRYIVVDEDGLPCFTNDENLALQCSYAGFHVVDMQTHEFLAAVEGKLITVNSGVDGSIVKVSWLDPKDFEDSETEDFSASGED